MVVECWLYIRFCETGVVLMVIPELWCDMPSEWVFLEQRTVTVPSHGGHQRLRQAHNSSRFKERRHWSQWGRWTAKWTNEIWTGIVNTCGNNCFNPRGENMLHLIRLLSGVGVGRLNNVPVPMSIQQENMNPDASTQDVSSLPCFKSQSLAAVDMYVVGVGT